MVPSPALPERLARSAAVARRYGALCCRRLGAHPGSVAALLAAGFFGYAAGRMLAPLPAGTWPLLRDSVIFEYAGWSLATGTRLYVDLWEVKPPLPFEVTALLAALAGDDVVLYHLLALAANGAAMAVGAAAAAGLVADLTDDPLGAVVAGATPFLLPQYVARAVIGFKAKYLVIAAGLSALYLAHRDRPAAAGVAGAAAVGCWQLAAVFPLAALGRCWQRGGRRGARRMAAGAAVTGVAVLLPVLHWGAVRAMVAEVVLVPLLVGTGGAPLARPDGLLAVLGRTLPVWLVGLTGLAGGLAPARIRTEWPLVLAAGWLTGQLVALDFDAPPDLFPWLALVGVGVGLAVGRRGRPARAGTGTGSPGDDAGSRVDSRRSVGAAVLALAVLSVATMGGYATGHSRVTEFRTYDTATELEPTLQYNATEEQYVFWTRTEVAHCRAFAGGTQYRAVKRAGLAPDRLWYEAPCGRFGPVWAAVRETYLGVDTANGTGAETASGTGAVRGRRGPDRYSASG